MNIYWIRQYIIGYLEQNGNNYTSCRTLADNLHLTYHQVYRAINSVSENLCLFEKQLGKPLKY